MIYFEPAKQIYLNNQVSSLYVVRSVSVHKHVSHKKRNIAPRMFTITVLPQEFPPMGWGGGACRRKVGTAFWSVAYFTNLSINQREVGRV